MKGQQIRPALLAYQGGDVITGMDCSKTPAISGISGHHLCMSMMHGSGISTTIQMMFTGTSSVLVMATPCGVLRIERNCSYLVNKYINLVNNILRFSRYL